jgi:DNA-binding protein H-NS
MHLNIRTLAFLPCAATLALVSSCATESLQELQEKEDQKTQAYQSREEKLEIRDQARQQRSDMQFNRIMGEPINSGDAGLDFPQ